MATLCNHQTAAKPLLYHKTLTSSGHQCIDALRLLNMEMVLHHHMPITSVHLFLCYTQHTENHLQQ